MHQLSIVAGVGNAVKISVTGLPVTRVWPCAALRPANGITITRVTQGITKTWPLCQHWAGSDTITGRETSHCQEFSVQSAEFRSPWLLALNNILPSQTCTGIPEIICIRFITTPLFLKIWNYAEILSTYLSLMLNATLWLLCSRFLIPQYHLKRNLTMIPANIHVKVTLNYSSKSHFEEVGNLVQTIYR